MPSCKTNGLILRHLTNVMFNKVSFVLVGLESKVGVHTINDDN